MERRPKTPRRAVPGTARSASRDPSEFGRSVRHAVGTLLADGHPDIRRVASTVQTSARTLQRRLHQAGLTYARVVAQARLDLARRMLDDPAHKIRDIARALGYSDHAHFTRAFHAWTGLSPRRFRQREHPDGGPGSLPGT